MAIKINVGVSRKIGLPDYGSAGSHCNIEIEADNSMLDNAEDFLQRVRNAYEMARQSVEAELAHHRPGGAGANTTGASTKAEPAQRQEYRQEYRNDNPRSDNNSTGNRVASPKQQQFIASLVKGVKGLEWATLDKYCASKWGTNTSQLSPKQASELIDDLKAAKSGERRIAV